MREPQRERLIRDLGIARSALYRALETSERGAYYAYEDALHHILVDTAALTDSVMLKREYVNLSLDIRA